jgi:hypothetical protein
MNRLQDSETASTLFQVVIIVAIAIFSALSSLRSAGLLN